MAKKIELKTTQNKSSVAQYLKNAPDALAKDGATLKKLFEEVTGVKGKMWGDSIVGYGSYAYQRSNGDYGDFMATGFSLRKSGPTLYIMPGYTDYSEMLTKLGPYKLGKSCLYLKSLDGIHLPTLKKLIKTGIKDLRKTHKVSMK